MSHDKIMSTTQVEGKSRPVARGLSSRVQTLTELPPGEGGAYIIITSVAQVVGRFPNYYLGRDSYSD